MQVAAVQKHEEAASQGHVQLSQRYSGQVFSNFNSEIHVTLRCICLHTVDQYHKGEGE